MGPGVAPQHTGHLSLVPPLVCYHWRPAGGGAVTSILLNTYVDLTLLTEKSRSRMGSDLHAEGEDREWSGEGKG